MFYDELQFVMINVDFNCAYSAKHLRYWKLSYFHYRNFSASAKLVQYTRSPKEMSQNMELRKEEKLTLSNLEKY